MVQRWQMREQDDIKHVCLSQWSSDECKPPMIPCYLTHAITTVEMEPHRPRKESTVTMCEQWLLRRTQTVGQETQDKLKKEKANSRGTHLDCLISFLVTSAFISSTISMVYVAQK
jgi:hypothetical protein